MACPQISSMCSFRTLNRLSNVLFYVTQKCAYAKKADTAPGIQSLGKKKAGKLGPAMEKKVIPVETDPHKLVNFVCGSNFYKEGEDIKLKPESEYPEWLWEIRTGKPPPLEELDPDTIYYWRRVKKMHLRRNNLILKTRKY